MRPPQPPSRPGSRVVQDWAGPLLVVVMGLALTVLMVSTLRRVDRELETGIARQMSEQTAERIEARFERLLATLSQWEGLVRKQPQRAPGDWTTWFERNVRDRFPEVQQVGFAVLVPSRNPESGLPAASGSTRPGEEVVVRFLVPPVGSSDGDEDPSLRVGQDILAGSVGAPDTGDARATLRRSLAEGETLLSALIVPRGSPESARLVRLCVPVSTESSGQGATAANGTGALFATLDLDRLLHHLAGTDGTGIIQRCRVRNDDGSWTELTTGKAGNLKSSLAEGSGLRPSTSGEFFGRQFRWEYGNPRHPALDKSRRRTAVAGGLGVVFTLLFAGLIWTHGHARRKETRGAAELRETHDRLAVVTRERERLTRDLHDGTIQSIYAVGFDLQRARNMIERHPEEARAELTRTLATLNHVVVELREFILHAEPGRPQSRNVDTALQALVERARRNTHAEIPSNWLQTRRSLSARSRRSKSSRSCAKPSPTVFVTPIPTRSASP